MVRTVGIRMTFLDLVTSKLRGVVRDSDTVFSWHNPAGVRFVFTLLHLPSESVLGSLPHETAVLVEFESRSQMVCYCKLIQQDGSDTKVLIPRGEEGIQWDQFHYRSSSKKRMFCM